MDKTFRLAIVTPEKTTWEGDVRSLVIPAQEGELGIWPGHAPLLAQLRAGIVRIHQGADSNVLAVSGGFVEVFNGRVAVFAETAEMADDINVERAHQAAEKAKRALRKETVPDLTDPVQARVALLRALARLKAANVYQRRRMQQPPS